MELGKQRPCLLTQRIWVWLCERTKGDLSRLLPVLRGEPEIFLKHDHRNNWPKFVYTTTLSQDFLCKSPPRNGEATEIHLSDIGLSSQKFLGGKFQPDSARLLWPYVALFQPCLAREAISTPTPFPKVA